MVIAGGGTGGHLYPGLAIAAWLRLRHPDALVLFVGTRDRLEAQKVPAAGFPLATISIHGLAGSMLPGEWGRRLRALAELATLLPLWQSIAILRRFRPQVLVATGGFVCGPISLAAWLLRIPIILVEQNELPGWTTRTLAHLARFIGLMSLESVRAFRPLGRWLGKRPRIEAIGNPVRPEVITLTRAAARARMRIPLEATVVLITGGSLGSRPLNQSAGEALARLLDRGKLPDDLWLIHVQGRNAAPVPERVEQALGQRHRAHDYLDDMPAALAAADLVITRAGGTFLAEVAARGVPAIVVPWAGAADRHQDRNAEALAQAGAAIVITDQELSGETLAAALGLLLAAPARRAQMAKCSRAVGKPQAAERVIEVIEELSVGA